MANTELYVSNVATVNTTVATDTIMIVTANGALRRIGSVNASIVAIRTPANSTINCASGQLFADGSYLYVATSDNVLKRIALTAF